MVSLLKSQLGISDEEIQEAKEKAEELVRQAQAEAAARRGDLEKVQSSAQSALEQQNKFLKQSEDALTRTQQKLKRADGTRSLLKKRDELMRIQEAIHRLQAMDMVPRLEPAPELLQKRAELQRMQAAIQQQVEMRATTLEEAKEEYKRKGQETREAIEGQKNQIKELQQRAAQSVRGQLEEKLEVTLSAKNAQIDALRLELNQATRSAQAETLRLELSQTTQIDALRLELAQAEARHASASRLLEARVVQVMEDAAYEVASMRALVDAAHSDARESVKLGLLEAQEAALRLARQLDVALGRAPLAEAELITQFERANAALLMPAGSGHAFLAHQSHPALVHKIGKENDEGDGLPDTLVFQSMKATRGSN
ncbi:hypothetical protein Ctob_001450 [Chrysochromulina tobinii]|uniref:Uncharacterized protein n=1 Tax=Chrysochromulina tobinii TaxID=1460289 RepID=A0A0M0J826_9EUKA|nr:hypothetical protein Ctob_001450 [Chrysochromulina tobinii]|eukprot:KOO22477.1 hypothetical protein Ctob_001450 [Chrysochromulina sp. CCMP291]